MRALTASATAIVIAFVLVLALATAPSLAWGKPHSTPGHAKHANAFDQPRGEKPAPAERKAKRQGFSPQDDAILRGYFSSQVRWTSLPAGIAKNYARGKKLPEDIAKWYLPVSLEAQLPFYLGASYYLIGRDVVLVDTTTRIVLDVLKDVFR